MDPGLHGPDLELGAWPAASGTVRAGEGGAPGAACITSLPVTAWDSQWGLCHVCVPVFSCCTRGEVSILGSTGSAWFRSPDSTHLSPMQPLLSVSVKRYIRKGVPLEHRARVWLGVSGAQAQMDQNPGYYQRLLQGEHNDRLEEAIRTGEPPRQGCGVGSPPGQSCSRGNIVQEARPALKWKFYFSEGKPKLKHSQGENSGFPCFCKLQQVGTGARAGPGFFRGELEGGAWLLSQQSGMGRNRNRLRDLC